MDRVVMYKLEDHLCDEISRYANITDFSSGNLEALKNCWSILVKMQTYQAMQDEYDQGRSSRGRSYGDGDGMSYRRGRSRSDGGTSYGDGSREAEIIREAMEKLRRESNR